MKNALLAFVALSLGASASAEECTTKTEEYQDKLYTYEICAARVDDVIKANADGFVKIDYIVQYRSERLVVGDTLARTNYAVGDQISIWVSRLGMPPDSRSQGFRTLSAEVIAPKPEAKPVEKDCPPSPTTSSDTTIQPFASDDRASRVDDVIKNSVDGFVQISYIVQYKGQRLVVNDPLARSNHVVGEQICVFVVGLGAASAESEEDRTLAATVVDPKPGKDGCQP